METPTSHKSLAGLAAIVTGGDSGIGQAISAELLRCGAAVGITTLPANHEEALKAGAALGAIDGGVRIYNLDVRSRESIAEAFGAFVSDFGRIDILVNNAGVRAISSSLRMTPREWDEVLNVNLRGVFFACQVAAESMRSAGGSIINIASQLGIVAAKDRAAYSASKAGVIQLTRSLALDWAPYAIRVNAVAPGPTNTPAAKVAADPQAAIDVVSRSPLGRPIEADEIAGGVAFLAGRSASAITGHTLVIDGGWTIT